jgi:hypothetical protein
MRLPSSSWVAKLENVLESEILHWAALQSDRDCESVTVRVLNAEPPAVAEGQIFKHESTSLGHWLNRLAVCRNLVLLHEGEHKGAAPPL